MSHGFLGYNATFMLDLVVCALVFVVPVLAVSIFLVKIRRNYVWHRRLQLFLAGVLLLAVVAFEVDLQVVHHGWQNIVRQSRPEISASDFDFVRTLLHIHLVFADIDSVALGRDDQPGAALLRQSAGALEAQPLAQVAGLDFGPRFGDDVSHGPFILLLHVREPLRSVIGRHRRGGDSCNS